MSIPDDALTDGEPFDVMMDTVNNDEVTGSLLSKLLRILLAIVALWYIVCFLGVALLRLPYPFELEWMEGGVLEHVHRIQHGQPIYVAPTLDFIPFIYPPFYYCVAATLPGTGFAPLRIVSFAASLGVLGVIYSWVRRETGSAKFSALAASFFCATYASTGAWFDTGRVDSLFLFFAITSLFVLRFAKSGKVLALAGIIMGAAFLTKTTMMIAGLPLIIWAIIAHRVKSAALIAPLLIVSLGGLAVFHHAFGDWITYYVFDLPAKHEIAWPMIWRFWAQDIAFRVGIAFVLAVVFVVCGMKKNVSLRTGYYLFAALGMIGAGYFSRLHVGGYTNVLMPMDAMLAVFFGLASHYLYQLPGSFKRHANIIIPAVCLTQFGFLAYDPRPLVPTNRDAAAGRRLVAEIAALNGAVYIPSHGYLAEMAGKKNCANGVAFYDVWRAYHGAERQTLMARILAPLKEQRFGAVITDSEWMMWQDWVNLRYTPKMKLFEDDNVFKTVSGLRTRPDMLFIPKAK